MKPTVIDPKNTSMRTVYHADNQSIIRVGIKIAAAVVFLAVAVGGLIKRLRKRRDINCPSDIN